MGYNISNFDLYDLATQAAQCAHQNCLASQQNASLASASAAAAAQSAEAAELYLGAFATPPVPPIEEGAIYYNTVSNVLFIWNGTAWVSADFNEFTNFTATGTTFARNLVTRTADVVNVKDFGAVGNGIINDAASIQAAEDFAYLNGKNVYFPAGIYIAETTLYRKGSTDWIGDGYNATIIKHSGGSDLHDIVNIPNPNVTTSKIGFYKIGFDGNRSGHINPNASRNVILIERNSQGLDDTPADDIRFIECKIFNFSYGGMGYHVKGYKRVQVKDSVFEDGGGGIYHPIYIRRCKDGIITGNISYGRDQNSCIKVQDCQQAIISNNVCQDGHRGILAQDALSCAVIGNTIFTSTLFGIDCTIDSLANSIDLNVCGNTVFNATGGIRASNISTFNISSNNIYGFSSDGINLRASRDGCVSSNTLLTNDSGGGEIKYVNLDAGPLENRVSISTNCFRNSRPSGVTYGIWTNETNVDNIFIISNAFIGTGWTQKHIGIITPLEPIFYVDTNTGITVNYDTRVFTSSLHEIHNTANISGNPSVSCINWLNANVSGGINLANSRSGVIGTNGSSVQDNDILGRIAFHGDHNFSFFRGAEIRSEVDGTPTPATNDMPGRLEFLTTPKNSTTPIKRLLIKENGSTNYVPMTTPASASAGDVYYDSGTNKLRCYNGTIWNDLF